MAGILERGPIERQLSLGRGARGGGTAGLKRGLKFARQIRTKGCYGMSGPRRRRGEYWEGEGEVVGIIRRRLACKARSIKRPCYGRKGGWERACTKPLVSGLGKPDQRSRRTKFEAEGGATAARIEVRGHGYEVVERVWRPDRCPKDRGEGNGGVGAPSHEVFGKKERGPNRKQIRD